SPRPPSAGCRGGGTPRWGSPLRSCSRRRRGPRSSRCGPRGRGPPRLPRIRSRRCRTSPPSLPRPRLRPPPPLPRPTPLVPPPPGSPRSLRGSSFFIPPVPPVILFARTTCDPNRLRPALVGAGNNTVPEPRNGVHHLAARRLVQGPAIRAWSSLEPERLAEGHRHLGRPRQAAAPGPRPAGASDGCRHHRRTPRHGPEAGAGLGRSDLALFATRPLGEHEQRAALVEYAPGRPQGARVGAFAANRARVERVDQRPEERDLEELRLGQIGQLAPGRPADQR